MTFSQRMKLVIEYRKWLGRKNEKMQFRIADEPDTFLLFLFTKGLLKEVSPECTLLHAKDNCEEYERQNNYTSDLSDLCASCIHNKNIEKEKLNGQERS